MANASNQSTDIEVAIKADSPAIPSDYSQLFEKFDIKHTGEISLQDFKNALHVIGHPIANNPELIDQAFKSFDSNNDQIIDFNDFKLYLTTTDDQILKGFNKIDQDNDGKLNRKDFVNYLKSTLHLSPTKDNIDLIFNKIDSKNDGYITYDEFREFLILMPRINGSRIKTAFNYIAEELDISSDGEVTLINSFLNGFGFFLAGGLSGVVSRTCTAPFDRIKVFLIARTDLSSTILHSKREIASHIANGASKHVIEEARKKVAAAEMELAEQIKKNPHQHNSPKTIRSPIIQAARTIWKQGGLKAFYVGNGLNVLKVFPESAMKFGSFEATKRFLAKIEGVEDTSKLSKVSTYMAGGIGGICGQFMVYPIDTLKFRLQCSNLDSKLKGNELLLTTAKEMFKEGGLKIFYRGIIVGVSGIFPYAALDLGTFTTIKNYLIKREAKLTNTRIEEVKLPNWMVLSLGAMSGTFGATVVYPVNLLRTRLQAQGTYAHPYTYTGFNDVLKKTIAREGYPGLFKGLVPNIAKVAPAVSISYFMYENLKYLFALDNSLK
ncbi:truncated non-functional calcium-binding mitochondrial carrier Sal1p-1 [[Candida] railenensis]|uniref:Mitochondrial thiamine pyrophosphate carrier 1 n=1 Tax=[Candida] railenensis TaxID=45579 RepID=A0A9P0QPK0_9ASCO|nr:truncated non-functional calcium-binding mitochondrial carrier Sal1p-1 [[Candida] railenensis]